MVSEKANQIGESPTLKVTAKAKAMKAAGVDIIDLSVGEPDFPTPDNIKAAGIRPSKKISLNTLRQMGFLPSRMPSLSA